MNKILIHLLLAVCPFMAFSQNSFSYYPGYVIFKENDTLFTKIAIDKKTKNIELSDLYIKVVYLDNQNHLDTTFSDETGLIGYSFKKDTIQYNFHKLIFQKKEGRKDPIFAWCMVGGYLKLYSCAHDIRVEHLNWSGSLYQNLNPNALMHEYSRNKVLNYYFQKGNGELILVPKNSDGSPNKKWLKKFFRDTNILSDKIGKEINIFDLEQMAKEYNALLTRPGFSK